ncbi:ectomycorrhiza-regulated protein [Moniliophthora roreri MCA 2997]|uniref:Ectomycorrhiza-regulated protein n=1 Tax=Moniliophthora roreri (strain MCA 2997) TaxID=1381753 RepID=V2XB24_MONRO|nr:ectomycorrhiza-regulated protein [Moniliophthora roreri MCA 2997]
MVSNDSADLQKAVVKGVETFLLVTTPICLMSLMRCGFDVGRLSEFGTRDYKRHGAGASQSDSYLSPPQHTVAILLPTLSHPSPLRSVAILPSTTQTHRNSFSGQGQYESRLPTSIGPSLSLQEMANQLGIPSRLPAPPGIGSTTRPVAPVIRTPPQPQQPAMAEGESPEFMSMLGNYLNMLGKQPASEPQHESPTAGTAALENSGANDALRNLGSWLASAALPGSTSPAFTDIGDVSAEAMNDFLTSPLIDDPYEEFGTSPLMDTPLLDFTSPLDETSPLMSDLNTPLIQDQDGSFEGEPLIVDPSVEMYKQQQQQQHLQVPTSSVQKVPTIQLDYDNMLKMSPNTPALQSFGEQFPSPAMSIDHSFSPAASSSPLPLARSRGRPLPTGTRRGITSASLIPEDAPTQPRHYVTPSATSRREIPSTFRKRPRAVDDDGDELDEAPPPNATEKEIIEFKRRQNTLAARKSRKRKMVHLQNLEETVTRLTREVEQWKTRAEFLEGMCVNSGLLGSNGLGGVP